LKGFTILQAKPDVDVNHDGFMVDFAGFHWPHNDRFSPLHVIRTGRF